MKLLNILALAAFLTSNAFASTTMDSVVLHGRLAPGHQIVAALKFEGSVLCGRLTKTVSYVADTFNDGTYRLAIDLKTPAGGFCDFKAPQSFMVTITDSSGEFPVGWFGLVMTFPQKTVSELLENSGYRCKDVLQPDACTSPDGSNLYRLDPENPEVTFNIDPDESGS